MVRKLPVLIECNSWTLPQERYNAEWVIQKRVGIVLSSFKDVVSGVQRMLEPATLADFRKTLRPSTTAPFSKSPKSLPNSSASHRRTLLRTGPLCKPTRLNVQVGGRSVRRAFMLRSI